VVEIPMLIRQVNVALKITRKDFGLLGIYCIGSPFFIGWIPWNTTTATGMNRRRR
jgi:hypothetical protein